MIPKTSKTSKTAKKADLQAIQIYLPSKLWAKLKAVAALRQQPARDLVSDALDQFLKRKAS